MSIEVFRTSHGITYVTFDMVRADGGEQAARRLEHWMRGQTMGIAENGDTMIYAWDYQKWLDAGPITD